MSDRFAQGQGARLGRAWNSATVMAVLHVQREPVRSGSGGEITLLRDDQAAISPGKEALPLGGINIRIFPCAAKA